MTEQAPEALGLAVSAVARRMGVAPATLRTWDRRYGIGPSEHQTGSHRKYSPADLARLEHMRRLVIAGIAPADAARAAREHDYSDTDLIPVTQGFPSVMPDEVPVVPGARAGGGRVVPLPGGGAAARGLARAAQALDWTTCVEILTESHQRRGVIWTWDYLVVPVMRGLGEQWRSSGQGVEVEHTLSAAVQEALSSSIRSAQAPLNTRTVLLACAPDDLHALPLWAVAAALAECRVGARVLGASLPASALASAVQRLGPAAVLVWAQLPSSADPAVIDELPSVRPAATILVGGPGWRDDTMPAAESAVRVVDLADAVGRIVRAVGG
jgi:DNA-binding transcriptional MerR regulator